MASLTKQDVLDTLTDPVLNRIYIYADGLWISSNSFAVVAGHIFSGSISVEQGKQSIAQYYMSKNKVVTQLGTSPPDSHARALLLHECMHAMFDVYKFNLSTVSEEVICYITQHLYLHLKIPGYNSTVNKGLDHASQEYLWQDFYSSITKYAKRGTSSPLVINTSHWEFKSLRNHLRTLNIYQHLQDATMSGNDGI